MKLRQALLVGASMLMIGVSAAFLALSRDAKVATSYSIEATEDRGTAWVKSCVLGDELAEVSILRSGDLLWSFKLVASAGVTLSEPVDIRMVASASGYELSGDATQAWHPGDQIVLRSTSGGYVSWALGAQPELMSLDELRSLQCVSAS